MNFETAYLTEQPEAIQAIAGLVLMVLLAYGARLVVHWILLHGFSRWIEAMQARWTRVVLHRNVLNRLEKVTPSLVVQLSVAAIPYLSAAAVSIIRNVAVAVTVLQIVRVLMALLMRSTKSMKDQPAPWPYRPARSRATSSWPGWV